ncbi:endonuclease [Apibacter sp. B3706]|uniref:endonuclease/exonuclease/phosphatase family protein n=1 Tax=Apibacter sp. B3706 TaxID=2656760 RepID=UPI001408A858|nr:endonuclease [Apibacter sp. B3706]QII70904.1 endonuclease [Apibacter sp. B3706]
MRIFLKNIFVFIFLLLDNTPIEAQIRYKSATVMFYNVENLYDTIPSADLINGTLDPNDPKYQISVSEDEALQSGYEVYRDELSFNKLKGKKVVRKHILTDEFHYKGPKRWNTKKYKEKINNISRVISETGKAETQSMPVIIGLCEIENEHVLNDLCEAINKRGGIYEFIHLNSFDERGIDVGLLYNKTRFIPLNKQKLLINLPRQEGYKNYTRDILLVEGLLEGEKMYFLVNHWPSRRGGEQRSLPKRMAAAKVLKQAMDSLISINPKAKIVAMGDFNDDCTSPSIKKGLNTVSKKENVITGSYYNPAENLFKKGLGTIAYQDSFSFFDQQIMSPALIIDKEGYHYYKMNVFAPIYLVTQEGPYKGYPFRTFSNDNYTGGYSDHFPVYTILIKEIK